MLFVRWRKVAVCDLRQFTMKVEDVMVKDVKFCSPNTNLAAATEMFWADCCGTLPVVDDRGNVVGIITDRDI